MKIEIFLDRLNNAATNNLLVSYIVDSSVFRIDGGIIDTMSYREYDDSIELFTEDQRHIITLNKDVNCLFNRLDDFSEEYKFGDLRILMLER